MMCIPLGGYAIRLSNTKHHTKEESAKTLQLPFIAVHHAKVPFKESLYSTASRQLKQDQVLSKWMGESWNLSCAELAIKLHISNPQQKFIF